MSTAAQAHNVSTADAEFLAYAGLVGATLGWSAAFVAGKVVLAEMTPLVAATWRFAIAATILLPFAVRRVPAALRLPAEARGLLAPLAVMVACGSVLYPWVFMSALARTSATNTALLVALNPVFTVLLAPLVGEALSRQRLAGIALGLTGAATVITKGDVRHVAELSINTGDLLAVTAAALWAVFNLAARPVVARATPAFINCVLYVIGGAGLCALGWSEHPWAQLVKASPAALAAIVAMAVLASVLAGQFFLTGVRVVGVGRSVVFIYLVPVLTAVLSAAFLGERFALAQAAGGAAVLAGVYWAGRAGGAVRPKEKLAEAQPAPASG